MSTETAAPKKPRKKKALPQPHTGAIELDPITGQPKPKHSEFG